MKIFSKFQLDKKYYEQKKQYSFFGYDNLYFKTINLPKRQRFNNLCPIFKLKKIENKYPIYLKLIRTL